MSDLPFASRGEERFVLRPRRRGGFEIVRQIDDIEFQGETREEARRVMLERESA